MQKNKSGKKQKKNKNDKTARKIAQNTLKSEFSKMSKAGIKNLAKQAKNRLKNGFWEDYAETVKNNLSVAESEGVAGSNVINYYKARVSERVIGTAENNAEFYKKVKKILDTSGDVSDILGRLCDEDYMKTLNFQQKQRYLFDLAANYRECRIRYFEEKRFSALRECVK